VASGEWLVRSDGAGEATDQAANFVSTGEDAFRSIRLQVAQALSDQRLGFYF
jgi:hypothetical protein